MNVDGTIVKRMEPKTNTYPIFVLIIEGTPTVPIAGIAPWIAIAQCTHHGEMDLSIDYVKLTLTFLWRPIVLTRESTNN